MRDQCRLIEMPQMFIWFPVVPLFKPRLAKMMTPWNRDKDVLTIQ